MKQRVYLNEDNIKNISSIKYINSPFNSAQKILTFDFNEVQKMGPGY